LVGFCGASIHVFFFSADKYTQKFDSITFIFDPLGDAVSLVELTEANENKGHPRTL
jgi:hypothetical protein